MQPQEQNQSIRKRISHKTSPKISPVTSPRISPLNSPVNPKPLGCGKDGTEGIAWLNSFVKGMANSHIIDKVKTQKHFKQLADIINDVTDKFQEITLDTNYFFMQDFKKIRDFGEVCHNLCNIIKRYTDQINDAVKTSEEERKGQRQPHLTKDDLNRFFTTITFYYDGEFKPSYKEARKLLNDRKQKEPIGFHFNKMFRMSLMSTLNKLWEVKLYIYIASKIFYNYYLFVFPLPITNMLDSIIRIIGLLCFTFASDPILLHPVLKVLKNITSLFGGVVYIIISHFLGIVFKESKLLKIINILMSYGYTYYTFGWLSKIIVSICKTFTVLKPIVNAASSSGISTLTYIKEIVEETGQSAIKKIQEASSEAITLIIAAGPAIMEGMSKFFANYILTYVMSFWDYLKNGLKDKLQSTILTSTLESIFKIWEAKSKELVTLQDKNKLEIYNKQTYNLVPINKQIISLIVPELIDELNTPLPLENGITVTDEDNIGEISVIQSTIKYPLFENAVMKNHKGSIYIDASILQQNFQEMTKINFKQVMEGIQDKVMKEGEDNFGKFYEDNIEKAGLSVLLAAMTKYIDSKDELNQPLLMLLFMGTEEVINVFITNNVKLTQKILLFMALIALFFLNVNVK